MTQSSRKSNAHAIHTLADAVVSYAVGICGMSTVSGWAAVTEAFARAAITVSGAAAGLCCMVKMRQSDIWP